MMPVRVLLAFVGWLAVAPAWAGYASAASSAFGKSGSGYSMKVGGGAAAANGAYHASASINMAGTMVTMPASARFAANAAQFAVGAMRLNPAALVLGAVAAWALEEGLEWANDSWTKSSPGVPYEWRAWGQSYAEKRRATAADALTRFLDCIDFVVVESNFLTRRFWRRRTKH
jgi:hypothetical protein